MISLSDGKTVNLCDDTPAMFLDKDMGKLRSLDKYDKFTVFKSLEYPASTWFYHNVFMPEELKDFGDDTKRELYKHLCYHDLFYFCKFILRNDKLREKPNREMVERIMIRNWPGKQERKLLCEPRGIYKTTIGSIGYPIWRMIHDPEISVQIDSETDLQAKAIFKTIKDILEFNQLLNEFWGQFRDKERTWNDTELVIAKREYHRRDPSLYHSGVDTSKNGFHPNLLIMDDPHSEINTQTVGQIDSVDDHYKLFAPLVDKEGEIIIICTRWVRDDLPGRIINRERDLFSIVSIKSAYNPDGSLYAEDIGLTHEYLESAKKTMGVYRFSANFLNDPRPDVDKSFKKEWLKFYNEDDLYSTEDGVPDKKLAVYLSVDASWADKNSTGKDPTAIIAGGFDAVGDLYILEVFNKRISPTEVIDQLFDMVSRWQPIAVCSEDVSTQKGINLQLEMEMNKRGVSFQLDKVRHQAISKENRILSLVPLFQNGNIHIQEHEVEFIEQFSMFNPIHKIEHDDILDALEMMIAKYRDFYSVGDTSEEEFYREHIRFYDPVSGRG